MVEVQRVLRFVTLPRRIPIVGSVVSVQVSVQVLQRVILRYKRVELVLVLPFDLFSSLVVNATVVSPRKPLGKLGKTWESELREGGEFWEVLTYSLHDVLVPRRGVWNLPVPCHWTVRH